MMTIALLIGLFKALLITTANGNHAVLLEGDSYAKPEQKRRLLRGNETQVVNGNVTAQIIGGLGAPKEFFTHQVSFIDKVGNHYCGGSLITDNIVLGAAHCVFDENSNYDGKRVMKEDYARINMYYQFSQNHDMEELRICEIIPHPHYLKKASHDFDFVLYRLCKSSVLAKKGEVIPITLNRKKAVPEYHQVLTVTGWGRLSNDPNNLPDALQMVNVNYIDNTECTTSPFKYTENQITNSMMCAGALVGGGRSSSKGDSGGPLIIQGNKWNKHVLVGVVSWGKPPFDLPNYPGVYGRVSHVIDWIKNTACPWIKGSCTIKTN